MRQPLPDFDADPSVGVRWIAARAGDVVAVQSRPAAAVGAPSDLDAGLRVWRRRIERRRLLVVARRAVLAGLVVAAVLALLTRLAGGPSAAWIVPAAAAALACAALGIAARGDTASTARLLDRDLRLHDTLATALELDASPSPTVLAAAVAADGRRAIGRALGGARAAARPAGREWPALVAAAAVLTAVLAIPPLGGQTAHRAAGGATVRTASGPGGGNAGAGPNLSGFSHPATPRQPHISATTAGSAGRSGALSGHSPYGSGIATQNPGGDLGPSRTLGASSSSRSAQAATGAGGASESGASSGGSSVSVSGPPGTAGSATVGGGAGNSGLGGGGGAKAPRTGAGVKAGTSAGGSPGGAGASAAGHSSGSHGGSTGGATAGTGAGSAHAGHGLVPQLAFGGRLPIQPGLVPSRATAASAGERGSAQLNGGGGASRVGIVGGRGGPGSGVSYIPPAAGLVGIADRELLLGYFAQFGAITAAGW